MPSVTVVVATHNRAPLLDALLHSLVVQDVAVIVIDDASSDDTVRVLAQCPSVTAFRLPANRGPAAARNVGWRAATTDIVAFTDDDCVADPDWVVALAAAFENADVVQGRTIADPSAARGPWSHSMEVGRLTGSFETCNVAYRRAWLERLGGFDESYRTGEDVDLGCRAVTAGARVAFAPDAVVRHDVSRSSWPAHVRRLKHRDGAVRAIAAHPEMRANLFHGWLFSDAHPPAVLAGLGLLLMLAGRRRAAVLVVPYVAYRMVGGQVPHARKWTWPWVVPLALGADLVECVVLARASMRYRTFVL